MRGYFEITYKNGYSVHRHYRDGKQNKIVFYDDDNNEVYHCDEVYQDLNNKGHIVLKNTEDGIDIIHDFNCKTWCYSTTEYMGEE